MRISGSARIGNGPCFGEWRYVKNLMATLASITFPDKTLGFGPFWAGSPIPKVMANDMANMAQYRFRYKDEEFVVFHSGAMTQEKEKIIADYAAISLKNFVKPTPKN